MAAVASTAVVAARMAAVASTAVMAAPMVAVVFMVEVAARTVAAGPTEEATGKCYCTVHSHVNGWRRMLPAVFLFSTLDPKF
jgi:hypothetical protein